MQKPQFIALLNFLSEKEGGRKTPTSSGYRAEIKFPFHSEMVLSSHEFIDTELVFSGDVVSTEITLIHAEGILGKIYAGLDFDFYEGEFLMGKGVITKMLKKELE